MNKVGLLCAGVATIILVLFGLMFVSVTFLVPNLSGRDVDKLEPFLIYYCEGCRSWTGWMYKIGVETSMALGNDPSIRLLFPFNNTLIYDSVRVEDYVFLSFHGAVMVLQYSFKDDGFLCFVRQYSI